MYYIKRLRPMLAINLTPSKGLTFRVGLDCCIYDDADDSKPPLQRARRSIQLCMLSICT